jgi:ubiquinone/menaquinone biosynthesis C-methylase UbiE
MGEKIFEEWRVYEKLLVHDYMDHRSFFGRLQEDVSNRYQRPIRILDLGCGDSSPMLPLLRSVELQRYVGVDESNGALEIAGQRLQKLGLPHALIQGDILSSLQSLQEQFDLVVASFSLHHFAEPDDKLRILQSINSVLGGDGMFALIDVFCNEQEPREDYLDRWVSHADKRYAELLPEEKQMLFDHVRARDFPVSHKHWHAMAQQAGLGDFRLMLQDSANLNGLVGMMRPA